MPVAVSVIWVGLIQAQILSQVSVIKFVYFRSVIRSTAGVVHPAEFPHPFICDIHILYAVSST